MGLMAIILTVVAFVLLIPVTVFVIECVAALLPERAHPWDPYGASPKTVVLVPAHNDGATLGATLESLKAACTESFSILVIADHCTDDTVEVAKAAGVECLVHDTPEQRGRGYALVRGLEHLSAAPPDVVIVVDADSRVSENALKLLAQKAVTTDRPVQADYLLQPNEDSTPLAVVSALAVLIKNRVRSGGLRRLGLPCQLTGNGAAFPYGVLKKASVGDRLPDDILLGVELAKLGHLPLSCTEAEVTSRIEQEGPAFERRRRAERGALAHMLQHAPLLIKDGFVKRSPKLVAMGLDLFVPPLALMVLLLVSVMALSVVDGILGGGFGAFRMLLNGLIAVFIAVGVSWFAYGRASIPFDDLTAIPRYIWWKGQKFLPFVKDPPANFEKTPRAKLAEATRKDDAPAKEAEPPLAEASTEAVADAAADAAAIATDDEPSAPAEDEKKPKDSGDPVMKASGAAMSGTTGEDSTTVSTNGESNAKVNQDGFRS